MSVTHLGWPDGIELGLESVLLRLDYLRYQFKWANLARLSCVVLRSIFFLFNVVNCSLKRALNYAHHDSCGLYRKQLQQQGDFSPCRTPTGLVDARDQYDLQLGRLSNALKIMF